MNSKIHAFILCIFLGLVTNTHAEQQTPLANFQPGVDYTELKAPSINLPELILVFHYQSPSSYQVLGALADWNQYSVTLWPAVFRESWRPAARLALIAQKIPLNLEQQLLLFQTILSSPPNWSQSNLFQTLLSTWEPDNSKLEQLIRNSELPKQLKSLQNQIKQYPISTVPTIIFKGRFIIDANQAKTSGRLIELLNHLNQQADQA